MYKVDITDEIEGVFAFQHGTMIKNFIGIPSILNNNLYLSVENSEFTFSEKFLVDYFLDKVSIINKLISSVLKSMLSYFVKKPIFI